MSSGSGARPRSDCTASSPGCELRLCIPIWDASCYAVQMSTQIAVRLPEELVRFLDESVAAGEAPSRAAVVAEALERELRRREALRDAGVLVARGAADDLDDLVQWSVAHVPPQD